MSVILTEEQILNGASLPEVRRSHEALRVENIRLAAWAGGKWNLECIACGRCPIYGIMETVGIEGKALCSDCRGMRRIREQNTRIAELEKDLAFVQRDADVVRGKCEELEKERDTARKDESAWCDAARDYAAKYNALVKERDGLRRAIEAMAAPCIEWMVSKNGADWERRISFIADNYVEKMVFGIAMAAKSALAAVPANLLAREPGLLDAGEFSCTICGGPAEFRKDEGIYRHKGHPGDPPYGAQTFCDKYGYPIEVVAAVPAPTDMEKTPEGENSDHIVEVNKKVGPHVGSHSPRNVWDGDRQIAYASDEEQAARIVAALKAEGNPVPLPSRERDDLSWLGKRPAPAPVDEV